MALDTASKRFSAIHHGIPWRGLGYFPTGTIDASERLGLLWLYSGISASAPVTVPDVVGQTQAAGTATLEGDGFVVSVATAYSNVVAAGLIISQVPAGGGSAVSGSTVTITVSLGDAPSTESNAGGWEPFWLQAERHRIERERARRRQRQIEEETRDIEEAQAREIAKLLRLQEERDAERAELQRLQKLADEYSGKRLGLPRDVSAALINAQVERTYSSLMQLQRLMVQAMEEEEAMVVALLLLDSD